MQEKDEDATLTQLAQVRFNLFFFYITLQSLNLLSSVVHWWCRPGRTLPKEERRYKRRTTSTRQAVIVVQQLTVFTLYRAGDD